MSRLRLHRRPVLALLLGGTLVVAVAQGPCPITVRPGSSVQAAVDAARPGTVVCLPPGTWQENLVLSKPVVLRGSGPDQTAILAREPGLPAIRVSSAVPIEVAVEGLTVGGSRFAHPYENHGILVQGRAYLALTDCAVEGNEWHGILIEDEAQVVLTRCRLSGNRVYGLAADGGARVTLKECTVEGNGSHGLGLLAPCPVTIEGSAVRRNGSHGIAVAGNSPKATISGCAIEGNGWCGVQVGGSAQVELVGNLIRGNGEYGVALYEPPCGATDARFEGRLSGARNTIPGPGSAGGNGLGAFCPPELRFLLTEAGGALDRR
ncbi:MAG: right-handed parallel beta-helix repeat-containing protein [Candidatus Bipolaricaulota bacterium]|nr:right-handed parallel beta-helix repeat-containing protein [Candidatus Bipolaricaulota bacterium]